MPVQDDGFEVLAAGEVISVAPSEAIAIAHRTFRSEEWIAAVSQQLFERGCAHLAPWFSDRGVEAEVLRLGTGTWQIGRVRAELHWASGEIAVTLAFKHDRNLSPTATTSSLLTTRPDSAPVPEPIETYPTLQPDSEFEPFWAETESYSEPARSPSAIDTEADDSGMDLAELFGQIESARSTSPSDNESALDSILAEEPEPESDRLASPSDNESTLDSILAEETEPESDRLASPSDNERTLDSILAEETETESDRLASPSDNESTLDSILAGEPEPESDRLASPSDNESTLDSILAEEPEPESDRLASPSDNESTLDSILAGEPEPESDRLARLDGILGAEEQESAASESSSNFKRTPLERDETTSLT